MSSRKLKILFITEKFSESGTLSNSFHTIFETYNNSSLFSSTYHVYLDELHKRGQNINYILLNSLDNIIQDVDAIFFSYMGCNYPLNPTVETILQLKNKYQNKKFIFWWWDGAHQCIQHLIQSVQPFADLQINCDGLELPQTKIFFTPAVERLYYPDKHIYDITFAGRTKTYPDRPVYTQYLLDNGINLNLCGGHVQENLSTEEYAKRIRQSKINLNFCYANGGWLQCKGRVFEILASQSMLLESEGPVTPQYLTEGIDYIQFTTEQDCLDKAKYYIEHNNERETIAEHGYKTYLEKYHYNKLWKYIHGVIND